MVRAQPWILRMKDLPLTTLTAPVRFNAETCEVADLLFLMKALFYSKCTYLMRHVVPVGYGSFYIRTVAFGLPACK